MVKRYKKRQIWKNAKKLLEKKTPKKPIRKSEKTIMEEQAKRQMGTKHAKKGQTKGPINNLEVTRKNVKMKNAKNKRKKASTQA